MISMQPFKTTQPANTFQVKTLGLAQGMFSDDPSTKNWLLSGVIASTVTGVVYGGMAITEKTVVDDGAAGGNSLTLATTVANTTGISVFNQAHHGLLVPGNSAPAYFAGGTLHYFRLGSNARIAVKCEPGLANTLATGNTNQQVAWDFTNQQLITYTSGTAFPAKVLKVYANSKLVLNTSNVLSWTTGPAVLIQI